jgi:hypothetical protein
MIDMYADFAKSVLASWYAAETVDHRRARRRDDP